MRALAAALALPLALASLATPAVAKSMSAAQMGELFCIARLADDMAPVLAVLTPELAKAVAAADPDKIRWQSQPKYANTCMPVGVNGGADTPTVIISYGYREGGIGYADSVVLRFIDERVRIDDIKFTDGTTLREALGIGPGA